MFRNVSWKRYEFLFDEYKIICGAKYQMSNCEFVSVIFIKVLVYIKGDMLQYSIFL